MNELWKLPPRVPDEYDAKSRWYREEIEFRDGLRCGFAPLYIKRKERFRYFTKGRTQCDAGVLLIMQPDGSTYAGVSHHAPNTPMRRNHAGSFDEFEIAPNQNDLSFALLLSSTESGKLFFEESHEELVQSMARKNKNRRPDIVLVDIADILDRRLEDSSMVQGKDSDIVLTQTPVDGGHDLTVAITNSDYQRTFQYRNGKWLDKNPASSVRRDVPRA